MAQAVLVASQMLDEDVRELKMLVWDGRLQRYFCQPIWAWPREDEAEVLDTVS